MRWRITVTRNPASTRPPSPCTIGRRYVWPMRLGPTQNSRAAPDPRCRTARRADIAPARLGNSVLPVHPQLRLVGHLSAKSHLPSPPPANRDSPNPQQRVTPPGQIRSLPAYTQRRRLTTRGSHLKTPQSLTKGVRGKGDLAHISQETPEPMRAGPPPAARWCRPGSRRRISAGPLAGHYTGCAARAVSHGHRRTRSYARLLTHTRGLLCDSKLTVLTRTSA